MSISCNTAPRLSDAEFCFWVGEALPGDTLEYHRGFIAVDVGSGNLSTPEQKALRKLVRSAAWASEAGLVHLVQRRRGPGDFSYLAVKRPRPRSTRRARSGAEQHRAEIESEAEKGP
ncbi:MAG: hypothetical protein KDJ88_17660 [Bauldia sp.]|nr:hypothetical protein [Bauldia sp.]